jgi:hypothetical protein
MEILSDVVAAQHGAVFREKSIHISIAPARVSECVPVGAEKANWDRNHGVRQ